jgi:hypothetical protein
MEMMGIWKKKDVKPVYQKPIIPIEEKMERELLRAMPGM